MASQTHLSTEEKQRYMTKTSILGLDPYVLPNGILTPLLSAEHLPNICFGDIFIYLIHNPSPYSRESLKAFKSTEAYLYFQSGWVKHSQNHSVTPTHPWITVQEDGTVLMAHCTCKAGLGEVCSHAAALLYAVLAAAEKKRTGLHREALCLG
ncbi:hypothetical protein N1851_030247 [Merluccius polli]|uniref:SWIM-type domain-containing protein n=1 Tax=Merluccius polli TaxID=89951 RepID=A0AA47M5Y8_MERPO|nr:hypothetical protein N1851_030247 [Merluccius polli]